MSVFGYYFPVSHSVWALIYVVGEASCRSVQWLIRPHWHTPPHIIAYMLNVAPNFFAGIYVPACYTFLMPFFWGKMGRIPDFNPQAYRVSGSIFGLTGVIGWELLQPFTQKFHFDPHDILWTVIGTAIFYAYNKERSLKSSSPDTIDKRTTMLLQPLSPLHKWNTHN